MKKTFSFLALGMMLLAGTLNSFAGARPTDGPADGGSVGSSVSGGVVIYEVTGWDSDLNAYKVQITGLDYDGLNKEGGVTELTVKTSFTEKWKTEKYSYYVEKIIDTDATAKKAFYAATKLTKLVFQAGPEGEGDEVISDALAASKFTFSIGNYAFYGCTKLATLTLPDNVNKIGTRAFQNTAITSFTIPAKCAEIGANAFYNTQKLQTVEVSAAGNAEMKKLGKQVFANSAVKVLNLANASALEEIEDGAFIYELSDVNYQLTTVTLPAAISSNQKQYGADNNHKHAVSKFTKINKAFANCTGLTALNNLEVSEVEDINDGAFLNCAKLATLNFPATAKLNRTSYTAAGPFQGCSSLATLTFACCWKGEMATDLYINTSLTEAEQAAELGYLKKLQFKGRVYGTIKEAAFGDAVAKDACSGLNEIEFLGKIYEGTDIQKSAFQNCAALKDVKFNGFIGDVKEQTNEKTIIIGESAFQGTALTAVDFKTFAFNSEKKKCELTINKNAFACDGLATVTFGKIEFAKDVANALIIKDLAFVSDALTTVNFACGENEGIISKTNGKGVLTIGEDADERAFAPATETSTGALTTVKFGDMTAGQYTINKRAFRSEALQTVVIGNVKTGDGKEGKLTIGDEAFGYVKAAAADSHASDKTVTIGTIGTAKDNLTVTVGSAAFYGDKLTTVKIGKINAKGVTIGATSDDATKGAFGGNLAAKTVEINGLEKNNGEDNSIVINQYAFYGDKLQSVLIGTVTNGKTVAAAADAATLTIGKYAFAGKELTSVTMGDLASKTSATFGDNSFANTSLVTDKIAYDYDAKIGKLNSDKLTINVNAFQGPQYDGSTYDVVIGDVAKAPQTIAANAFVGAKKGATTYTLGSIAAGTFANIAGYAFVGSFEDGAKVNNTDVTLGEVNGDIINPYTFTRVKNLTTKAWNVSNTNLNRFYGVQHILIDGNLTGKFWGDGGMNSVISFSVNGDVTAPEITSFGTEVRKVMFLKNNAKIPAGIISTGTFKAASDAAKDKEKIVVRYYVDEDNAIESNQIFAVDAFGSDDAYTNVDLYCSEWQKANTFENTDIIGAPGHIYRMQFSSSNIIPGDDIVATATVQTGGKYAYGRLYIPAGNNNYYTVSANKVDGVNTVNVFSATVDGEDIYMKPVDVQDGAFWIDATAVDQVFVVRTSNIADAEDGKVAINVEYVDADAKAKFEADGGYFFDANDAKKNALRYVKQTIINTELQNTAPYKDKGIYVMANPKTRGLGFAKLDQFNTARDLTAGNVYVLTKKTSAARLNVIFEGETDGEATGIKAIDSNVENGVIYNLQGVRVNNAQKGIFIINGKKVIK